MENFFDSTIQHLQSLTEKFDFFSVTSLGQNILGKNIPLLALGEGKKAVVYIGDNHETNSIASAVLLKFAQDYCALKSCHGHVDNLEIDYLYNEYTFYIVPMLDFKQTSDSSMGEINNFIRYNNLKGALLFCNDKHKMPLEREELFTNKLAKIILSATGYQRDHIRRIQGLGFTAFSLALDDQKEFRLENTRFAIYARLRRLLFSFPTFLPY